MSRSQVAHGDRRGASDNSRGTQSAAEYIAADRTIINIHRRTDAAGSQIAAAIHVAGDIVVDIHRDIALRRTIDIVAAEDVVDRTAVHRNRHCTTHIRFLIGKTMSAAVDVTTNGTALHVDLGEDVVTLGDAVGRG